MQTKFTLPVGLTCLLFCFTLSAQQPADKRNFVTDNLSFSVSKTDERITADGLLTEAVWNTAEVLTDFSQKFPTDTAAALAPTEIRLTYNNTSLFVAVTCYSKGSNWVVPSLRRDYGFIGTDNITLMFDTFNDKTNAFVFGINAKGARREALVASGGRNFDDFSDGWDNKWRGDAKIQGDFWTAEFEIPFNILRFDEGTGAFRFSAYRYDTQHNEISVFVHVPGNFTLTDLTYMADVKFAEPLRRSGSNISLIPYIAGAVGHDFENAEQTRPDGNFSAGGDVKVAVTSGLNLDLTVNPDFSQVEVDRQVTNLNRFELFFPERRQFFLENADLFSSFGTGRSQPFFSRRIGISRDTATGTAVQNTIYYGARLSGKLNERTRVGLLNMQTAAREEDGLPGFNYSVGVLQQLVGERSNVSFIGINKQAINPDDFDGSFNNYNRILGGEYNLATVDNRWKGKFSHQQAFTTEDLPEKFSNNFFLEYSERAWRAEIFSLYVGAGYNAETGFVLQRDIHLVSPEVGFNFYPEKGRVSKHSIDIDTRFIHKIGKQETLELEPWTLSEVGASTEWNISFQNFANLTLGTYYDKILLFRDFDPTREQEEGIFLAAGDEFNFVNAGVRFRSDRSRKVSYSLSGRYGGFFNGTRANLRGDILVRFQPYGTVALNYSYNRIVLAEPFRPVDLWLVGPRIDLTFSKKLFLTTFVQFNSQTDNLNINARLQWRFQPVSDFFLVYTDNYLSDDFTSLAVRNRAVVAKVTYWLNL